MRIPISKSSFTYFLNCVVFELISGQMSELSVQTSGFNLTTNTLVTKSGNSSLILDILHYNEITLETIANSSVNICDEIDCTNNIAICEENHCPVIKRMRKHHYIVTCVIVVVMIGLMLIAMYACRKESKRLNRWHNAYNRRAEDQMIAIRLVQSLECNQRHFNIPTVRELTPLTIHSERPPPYDESQYTPPPDYQEVVQSSNRT